MSHPRCKTTRGKSTAQVEQLNPHHRLAYLARVDDGTGGEEHVHLGLGGERATGELMGVELLAGRDVHKRNLCEPQPRGTGENLGGSSRG